MIFSMNTQLMKLAPIQFNDVLLLPLGKDYVIDLGTFGAIFLSKA